MSTPHIKLQLTLGAGEERTEMIELAAGTYRVRTLEPGGEETVDFQGGGFPAVVATDDGVGSGRRAPPGQIVLANRSGRSLTIVVEERAWMRDALTAHRATALQAFRDLFTDDVLRPGDSVEIDHITLMFSDLKGSTALYDRIDDPEAYALVREHFAILGKAIRETDGVLVKTIGDAVMGAWADPVDALVCAFRIQADFADYNRTSGKEPIVIKLGLHMGRCISVTLNGRLDYYGSAANMAARLEGQSGGGDIVFSRELAADPGVRALLAPFALEDDEANLKGFGTPVPFFRITAEALAAAPQGAPSPQP
ncbi:MAG: adenylate/guanylate cyclase domain-containing protein [Rhodospirillales bacterium]|nr:adenylate/guanylate cyclase domain-containing protein [Rhodospirillales bacterium]